METIFNHLVPDCIFFIQFYIDDQIPLYCELELLIYLSFGSIELANRL